MRNWIDFTGPTPSRRDALMLLGGTAMLGVMPIEARAQAEPTEAAVLHDPDNPVLGNPDGDITIVEWFDFNCPYCRRLSRSCARWCRTTARYAWC